MRTPTDQEVNNNKDREHRATGDMNQLQETEGSWDSLQ